VANVEVIKDRDTGRSKGFAFVEMSSQADVENAIQMFNGFSLDNRQLKVNVAKPREERPRGGWYNDSPKGEFNKNRRKPTNTRRY
jgi:RNA recognition motif-containing protein